MGEIINIFTIGEKQMDVQRVNPFLTANQKYLPEEKLSFVKQKLLSADETAFALAQSVSFKNPTTILVISVLFGGLGIDRFMLGETGMGVLKLFTLGCCGILTIIDWFSVGKKAREKNFNALMMSL